MDSINDIVIQIRNLKNDMENSKIEFIDRYRKMLKNAISKLFDLIPELKAITWTQYTPYFNDGDVCEFSLNDRIYIFGEYDPNDILDYYEYYSDDNNITSYSYSISKNKDILNFDSIFSKDFMIELFGDHCQVTIDKNNINVLSYEHE